MLVGFEGKVGHVQNGGVEIGAYNGFVADATGTDGAGPFDDHRFTNATLVKPAFAGAQGNVGGRMSFRSGQASVVRHKEGGGVGGQIKCIELADDLTDGLIHGLDHAGIDGVLLDESDLTLTFLSPDGTCRRRSFHFILVFLAEIAAGD